MSSRKGKTWQTASHVSRLPSKEPLTTFFAPDSHILNKKIGEWHASLSDPSTVPSRNHWKPPISIRTIDQEVKHLFMFIKTTEQLRSSWLVNCTDITSFTMLFIFGTPQGYKCTELKLWEQREKKAIMYFQSNNTGRDDCLEVTVFTSDGQQLVKVSKAIYDQILTKLWN